MITKIRNLSIIAHIDHGKSTLADRLIEFCGSVKARNMKDRILDSMELEKERGITIKAQTVRLTYHANNNETYILNLMDTPGHVDFSYEVSRCLSACEGAVVVVDASQGVEAQTLSNVYMAVEQDRILLPVLNKIDLPSADIDAASYQIKEVLGLSVKNLVKVSAKNGEGIDTLLQAIVDHLPAPNGNELKPLQALLVDSWYNSYLGVICLVRIMNGSLESGKTIRMMSNNSSFLVERIGVFTPDMQDVDSLKAGEIGYFIASIKTVKDCRIGDTITYAQNPCQHALPGFKPSLPVVFCGLFPVNASEFLLLNDSLDKLALNDSSFSYQKESSTALGLGFRCGFLGLLHLEIVQERLEREFNLELVSTAPSVIYHVFLKSGEMVTLHNPSDFPDCTLISYIKEPWIKGNIISPEDYIGDIMVLCKSKRGVQKDITYIAGCVVLQYCFPLNEIVFDFYDRLKSISRGYASFDYELSEYQMSDLVKVQILINQERVDALAMLVHRNNAEMRGRTICKKLKALIPRQLYQVAIQAAIGGKIIARETVSALRKDVTAKCYGGDISRKRKLLEKQKMGKKRMRSIGKVDIPYNAFIKVLRFDS